MYIAHLEIANFRNFTHIIVEPSPKINLFYGQNGSGKTSLLEAIHYLGLGRSFRTRNLSRIINQSSESFSLFAKLYTPLIGLLTVGIERKKGAPHPIIKVAGKSVLSLIELADKLPIQFINADSHLLLTSGPLMRRQFLDWGTFHVEPSFFLFWQRAMRSLKQRNASLKNAHHYQDVQLWDEELDACARWLHEHRAEYVEQLKPHFMEIIELFIGKNNFILQYNPGWDTSKELKEVVAQSFQRDRQLGYTQYGPHRADLQLKINNIPAGDLLSQGQQKLAAYAFRLAQGKLMELQTSKQCIFLIDDLPSELDPYKRKLVAGILSNLKSQIFVTGIEAENLSDLVDLSNSQTFHVEHGRVNPNSFLRDQ